MERVLNIKKAVFSLVFSLVFVLFAVKYVFAASYSYKNYGSTDFISHDNFNQICNVLAAAAGDDTSQGTTPLHPTGVTFGSYEEAIAAENAFRFLYMGETDFGIAVLREGASGYIYDVVRDGEGTHYSFHYTHGYGPYTLLVGWLSGSDPAKCVSEHNQAMEMISNIVASAPEDPCSAYRYYNDWLCNNANYDYTFNPSSYSGYGALCTGASVCAGYAKAFMGLCYKSGKYCITVSGTKAGGNHSWNAVWDGVAYKWVDVTFADQNGWINYGEFMSGMEDNWIDYFNEPFCTVS